MMKTLILVVVMLSGLSIASGQNNFSIDEILSQQYEFKMISSGNNLPNFNTSDKELTDIVVLLHHGKTPDEIQKYFNWDDRTFDSRLEILKNADFVKSGKDGNLLPNVFVCPVKDGLTITRQLNPVIKQTADTIQRLSINIARMTGQLNAFKKTKFEDVSFLILSDVLLDNWQINNVENDFLKTLRTSRHGKHYYASYQENLKGTDTEAFGIYGNQVENASDFAICRYGNRRYSKEILSLNADLKKEYASSGAFKQFSCSIIDTTDNSRLQLIADSFKPSLIKILNQNKNLFQKNYKESPYSKEISFEEYFIWVYHFYYTAVTNELINRNVIKMPGGKVIFYILKNE